jgi:hypothetical protein
VLVVAVGVDDPHALSRSAALATTAQTETVFMFATPPEGMDH